MTSEPQQTCDTRSETRDSARDDGVGFSDVVETIRRTARRSTGAFAVVWLATTIAEYAMARRLLERLLDDGSGLDVLAWSGTPLSQAPPASIALGCAGLVALAAFKIGLYRPLRSLVLEGRHPSIGSIVGSGLARMGVVLRTQVAIVLAMVGAMLAASWIGSTFPLFVLLPLSFTLAPAVYIAAARETGALEALGRALELARQYWPVLFTTHGIAVWLSLFGSGSGLTPAWLDGWASMPTLSTLKGLSIHLLTTYLGWLVVAAGYLALDEAVLERRDDEA
jgi:hypothetical protein